MKRTPKKGARRYGDGRAAFLGHLQALQKWVGEGRTLKAFYDDHAEALKISYAQFTRHARTYIENPKPSRRRTDVKPQVTGASVSRPAPKSNPSAAPQFRHQADAGDKDDLI